MKVFIVLGLLGLMAQSLAAFSLPTLPPVKLPKDIEWTQAINDKLCEPGSHPDAISQAFYACYDETIVKGADQFIHCQEKVYKVHMDTEQNVDTVCNAPSHKFPEYAGCIMLHLPLHQVKPSDAIHQLNICQGAVMGVPEPEE